MDPTGAGLEEYSKKSMLIMFVNVATLVHRKCDSRYDFARESHSRGVNQGRMVLSGWDSAAISGDSAQPPRCSAAHPKTRIIISSPGGEVLLSGGEILRTNVY